MPNHVRNIVKMEGIADLPYFTEVDGHRCFDFNKLVAMPKDLQIEDDTLTDERIMYFITERCQIPLSGLTSEKTALLRAIFPRMYKTKLPEDIFQRVSSRLMTATEEVKERVYEYGRRYVSNIEKYGAPTWYLWCIRHWGTKWNAGYTEIIDRDTIQFDTAWSNPAPILQKLGELHPAIRIEHWWADEDVGQNTGHRILFNGDEHVECFAGDKEALDLYEKCWGECDDVYIDENGEVQYRDSDD